MYESFVKNAVLLLRQRSKLAHTTGSVPAAHDKKKSAVAWKLTYEFPTGLSFLAEDAEKIDQLLSTFPRAVAKRSSTP
jgi:hypothetical protein